MSRFDRRMIRGLDEIAEQVTPSSSALADFRSRVAQQTPQEEVVIMLTPNNTPPRRPRRVVLTVVGAAAVLGLALAGIVLLRSDGEEIVTTSDEPIQSEPAATVAPTPANVPPFDSLQWSRVPEDSTPFVPGADDTIDGVTAWGDGFVAVGVDGSSGRAAAWLSEDGNDWSLVFVDEPPPGAESRSGPWIGSSISDVVAGGPGLVAAGTECTGFEDCQGKIWTSTDGRSWSKTDIEPGIGSLLYDITAGGPGLVVGGEFAIPGVDARGAVWTSVDGITWTRVFESDTLLTEGIELVAAGESGLVAVGAASGGPSGQPRTWTSPDGLSWTVHEDVPQFSAIAATGSGFVAVGTEELTENACHAGAVGDCRAAVWTSVDGITWTRVPHNDATFGAGPDKQMMSDVTAIDSGLLAVGTSVWYSPDGTTWSQIYHDPALAGDDGHVDGVGVAVGESAVVAWNSARTPILWNAQLPS